MITGCRCVVQQLPQKRHLLFRARQDNRLFGVELIILGRNSVDGQPTGGQRGGTVSGTFNECSSDQIRRQGMLKRVRGLSLTMAALAVGCLALTAPSAGGSTRSSKTVTAAVPSPTVKGPILPTSGISFLGSTLFPLSQVGYEESEYFISGTATSFGSAHKLTSNGRWHVVPAHHAAYTTRVIVYRPIDPSRFDGTVGVEWLNVTGGVDAAAAWLTGHTQMIRDGMAYVGVDAQEGGIYGEKGSIASADGAGGIKQTDPARYGALQHPGDSYSYSIFEQTGEAVHASAATLLGGLQPKRVIAIGESQSAFRLVTYIDAIQPLSPGVYDGYFVYSRAGDGADLSQSPQTTITTPTPTYIRTDVHVPVLLFETEADLLTLGYKAARQPPTNSIREWEVAGTAHDDTYGLLYSRSDNDNGVADIEAFESMLNPPKDPIPGIVDCPAPINAGSHTYEVRAAINTLNRWVSGGQPARQSPRLELAPGGKSFLLDSSGNALGGVRTPQVVAPVAKLSGIGQPNSSSLGQVGKQSSPTVGSGILCNIFGTTVPLSAPKLASLYPTHAAFVRKWDAAVASEVRQGYLMAADGKTLDKIAAASTVGG